MEADLTRRQQLAWCFGALGVPAMLLCAAAAWQWVLLAGALVNGHGGDQARVRMALETGQKLNENAFVNKIVVIKNEEIVA